MPTFEICDDQLYVCRNVEERIKSFIEPTKLDYAIYSFTSGEKLLGLTKS